MYEHPFGARVGAIAVLSAAASTVAASGLPVLEDDFDDNMIGDLWLVFEQDPAQITVAEQNMRLEFPAAANSGTPAGAAIVSNGWAIDANADFRFTIDAHRDLPTIPGGDIGLEVILGFVFDLEGEEGLLDGVSVYIGSDEDGPYIGYEVARGGGVTEDGFLPAPAVDFSIFVWYESATDTISFSPVAYFDAGATQVFGMRTSSESDRPQIAISAFTEGVAPAVAGSDLFFDEFAVDAGVIVQLCAEDVDGDGAVGFSDILAVLGAWGPCGGCPEDIDGDGVVGFAEILRILGAWGGC